MKTIKKIFKKHIYSWELFKIKNYILFSSQHTKDTHAKCPGVSELETHSVSWGFGSVCAS